MINHDKSIILIVYPHYIPMITGPHNLVVNHQFSNVCVSRSPTMFFSNHHIVDYCILYPRSGDIHHINIYILIYDYI